LTCQIPSVLDTDGMRTRRSRAEQVEQNRAAVLAAARTVFLAKGYAGATLEAIADEAGFSKGVVYSQFEGKADLFLALLESRIDERAAQNQRLVADTSGTAGLLTLLENFERDARVEAGWSRVLVEFRAVAMRDSELNRRYVTCHAKTVDRLAELIAQLHQRGGIEPSVEPRTMAEFILAFGAGLALERAADASALPWPALAHMMVAALGFEADDRHVVSVDAREARH
jgi:AcrR family transcriptional regulator